MSNSEKNMPKDTPLRRRALVPKEQCPMAQTAELIGDKWTMLILREAFYGVVRYDDMLQDLGASRSTLTDRLNDLIRHDVMERRPYQEPGERQRQYYALTARGRALAPIFIAMTKWGEDHLLKGAAPVQIVDQKSGEAVYLGIQDKHGQPLDPSQLTLVKRP